MEKQKRWQLIVIVAVILLTLYNILPTIFYYSKPLKEPINEAQAQIVQSQIASRVNSLEDDAKSWVLAFSKNLGITAKNISLNPDNPKYIQVTFENAQQAGLFKRILPRAGLLIPFVPAQLDISHISQNPNEVTLQRRIGIHFEKETMPSFFSFVQKVDEKGTITPFYQKLVFDRIAPIALAIAGKSESAQNLEQALALPSTEAVNSKLIDLSKKIVLFEKTFGSDSEITKRYYASFTQTNASNKLELIDTLQTRLEALATQLSAEISTLSTEQKELQTSRGFADSSKSSKLKSLENDQKSIELAKAIIQRSSSLFKSGQEPLTSASILNKLQDLYNKMPPSSKRETLSFDGLNPFIAEMSINWANDQVSLTLQPELQAIREQEASTETNAYFTDLANTLVVNEIAKISKIAGENISPDMNNYVISLRDLTNSTSLLALNLAAVADAESTLVLKQLNTNWQRESTDLTSENFPIMSFKDYQNRKPEDKKLGLVIYSPLSSEEETLPGFKPSSIYVIAKGLQPLAEQFSKNQESASAKLFIDDYTKLQELLQQQGFFGYPAVAYNFGPEFKNDYIFELDDYYSFLIKSTREAFSVHGTKHFAVLEFTDVEQRILALNRIEDSMHEDLLKWKDAYHAAQVDLNLRARYDVPPVTKSVYWDNVKLSFAKYFRGDDRKILKWGLDLSGGKTVRIGLKDQNGKSVTDPAALKEGVNELYKRVNKMGVSEVGIRVEGTNIILDFPGSQGLSAAELIKASSMSFHVVNEKFGKNNQALASNVNQFLQEVWNESVVTNRKGIDEINQIAWRHLGGTNDPNAEVIPQSESAKVLYDSGLRLAGTREDAPSSSFSDTLSSIAMFRGEDFVEWQGQSHPLIVVFHNYALEGSRLQNIQAGYDPTKGNILSFGVASSSTNSKGQKSNARDDFFAWTSQFSQEKIVGTPKESYSNGAGWRMAVILNGSIVNAPTLNSPLRDHAMLSGHFSQREVNQLAADLKAGSLSFTPKILSEQNVSPDLGLEERSMGITAFVVATLLVILAMLVYYRFAGLVASVAVLFLLLIMWGVLQNLDAALTLPGIAGIILTIGMAVDANVLVYERIKEEFALTKRLPSAVQAGYRKAFSAIIDSNITTLIAAIILLQFDSGPIKGFALTLIIGIIASMFTSLFMTRYFFAGWVQNPKHKVLNMLNLIGKTSFDFIKHKKTTLIVSLIIVVVGGYFLVAQRNVMLGMDFTGGFALSLEVPEKANTNYKQEVSNALIKAGSSRGDFQIRELNTPGSLRIQFGRIMEEAGHPFYGLPIENNSSDLVYNYEQNPRIAWVVQAMLQSNISLNEQDLVTLDQNWSEMSGQLSDTMLNNALLALFIALLCILIYITIRFEFKYAISAILGLAYDIVITLSILGILHLLNVPVQIDLQVIAALMTIIGYSLNDTIIIFDRIREDIRLMKKVSFETIVNHALNATLSRTLMTSGTTVLVLATLVTLGGSSILDFSLVMTIGVIVGTLSSLFVAAPLLLYFHNKGIEEKDEPVTRGTIVKLGVQ
ncbi:MAG: protein translocase subunit SecD [Chlamydiales bacterium]|nr:protein translocase subunit SecD [Chlamydiales bacterium]